MLNTVITKSNKIQQTSGQREYSLSNREIKNKIKIKEIGNRNDGVSVRDLIFLLIILIILDAKAAVRIIFYYVFYYSVFY